LSWMTWEKALLALELMRAVQKAGLARYAGNSSLASVNSNERQPSGK
jgi:hypothetical protein